jgi:Photosynthesis system II assembly factor YCF48
MAQLPEIARLTLKRMPQPEVHPEPGQLAAFAEQALPQHQRAYVLNHLASCGDCREWLHLTLADPVEAVQHSPAPAHSWSFWESLRRAPVRWAGVAATAAVITAAVWVGQLQNPATPLPSQAQIFRAEPQAPEPQARWAGSESSTTASAQSKIAAVPNSRQRFLLDPQAITAPPGSSVASAAPAKESPNAASRALSMAAAARNSNPTPLSTELGTLAESGNSTTSSPAFDNTLWATGMLTSAPTPAPSNMSRHAQWMISADGILLRSLDHGFTWQDYAMQSGARLRAVVAVGNDVWVGGSNGILYHSADSGQQWRRVIPVSPQGRPFAGDVVSLEFADAQSGTVTTSSGDRWVTGDGGVSWRLH